MKVVLHIGLPKTATTTLQGNVFYQLHLLGKINFLGRYSFESGNYIDLIRPLRSAVLSWSDKDFNENILRLKEDMKSLMDEDRVNVISDELFSMTSNHSNYIRNCHRLKIIFEDHEVILAVGIRKQSEIIYSYYVELKQQGLMINDWKCYLEKGLSSGVNGDFGVFFYDHLLNNLGSYFSTIKVLIFEDLASRSGYYVSSVGGMLGISNSEIRRLIFDTVPKNIKERKSDYTSARVSMRIILINFLKGIGIFDFIKTISKYIVGDKIGHSLMFFLDKISIKETKIPLLNSEDQLRIRTAFQGSNDKLSDLIGRDLNRYGY